MEEEDHLPVGLCRMKNRKGLSTINQGGDDLAIRMAAVGRKGNMLCTQQGSWPNGALIPVFGDTLNSWMYH